MTRCSSALAAALAVAASAALVGAAKADGTLYYYYDASSLTYSYTPRVYYYSDPVVVAPAPRVYYYSQPRYVLRSNTTYYYAPSNHDHYSFSTGTYVAPPPADYVPPGLSLQTPIGTYAPFYGGWNPYNSTENVGGYNAYRDTAY